jgi:hypothetical protein
VLSENTLGNLEVKLLFGAFAQMVLGIIVNSVLNFNGGCKKNCTLGASRPCIRSKLSDITKGDNLACALCVRGVVCFVFVGDWVVVCFVFVVLGDGLSSGFRCS